MRNFIKRKRKILNHRKELIFFHMESNEKWSLNKKKQEEYFKKQELEVS